MKINNFNNRKLKKGLLSVLLISISCLISCKKYLDLKPNSSLYIASTLKDCQALLDDYSTMNGNYPSDGEAASDNYYLTNASYLSLPEVTSQETYIWAPQGEHATAQWAAPYKAVFNSNLVLQLLSNIDPASSPDYNMIKGSALFFRGYAFFSIASLFCKPYDPASSSVDPGIPLRLSPDIDQKDNRGTVQQTYDRIINDLKDASELLSETSPNPSRPTKTAALGIIARVYLAMGDYTNAGLYADACLKKYNVLLNFNSLMTDSPFPFQRFNSEVIFQSIMAGGASLNQTAAKVLEDLYNSYSENDIRKSAYFKTNPGIPATYAFKGSYDGSIGLFNGLSTDEMYLIRAECFARSGQTVKALKDLNDLLVTRFKITKDPNGNDVSTYTPYVTANADVALDFILNERRKELYFRSTRWTDLRRLNKESRFAVTLSRSVGGGYSLPPNDLRYTFLIPRDVINNSSIIQNAR